MSWLPTHTKPLGSRSFPDFRMTGEGGVEDGPVLQLSTRLSTRLSGEAVSLQGSHFGEEESRAMDQRPN